MLISIQFNKTIGCVRPRLNGACHNAELGYWIKEDEQNKGYCTEASKALIKFRFETLNLNKIYALHMIRNPSSGRVLEKLDFKKKGL